MCIICKTNHRVTHQPTDDDYDETEAGEHFYLFIRCCSSLHFSDYMVDLLWTATAKKINKYILHVIYYTNIAKKKQPRELWGLKWMNLIANNCLNYLTSVKSLNKNGGVYPANYIESQKYQHGSACCNYLIFNLLFPVK